MTLTMLEAINQTMAAEMERDERVIVIGEDVGAFGGCFGVTQGLYNKFGADRVIDTPIAEATLVGAAVGMAITGLKPICELMFADFYGVSMDEIANKMAKWRYMHGGRYEVPMTLRMPIGMQGGAGPEHSQSAQAMFINTPGLILAVPSNPADAAGLLRTAIRGQDPVLFFEHKILYGAKGDVPDGDYMVPFGKANICRQGSDITIVATALQVTTALAAAEKLAAEGISCEVIDPRTLFPLDKDSILQSVKQTGRLLIVHEDHVRGGSGAEIAAIVSEEAIFDLKAPVKRIGAPFVPIPQNAYLEQYYIPSEAQVIAGVKELMAY